MSSESPHSAFALSLAAGILMLLAGGLFYLWFGGAGFGYGMFGGMMGGYQGMMGSYGAPFGFMNGLVLIGLISGVAATIGALLLNSRPAEHVTWGTLILAFSLVGFLGMDGFFIGAILGVVGGTLALSWRPAHEEHIS